MSDPIQIENLKKFLKEQIESEREDYEQAKKNLGANSVGAAMAIGALDAYQDVLNWIKNETDET